jgi:oleate hydratase
LADDVRLPALVERSGNETLFQRYCHHIDGLPDFSALRFTKYNQYESMILPLQQVPSEAWRRFRIRHRRRECDLRKKGGKKAAKEILYKKDGKRSEDRSRRG